MPVPVILGTVGLAAASQAAAMGTAALWDAASGAGTAAAAAEAAANNAANAMGSLQVMVGDIRNSVCEIGEVGTEGYSTVLAASNGANRTINSFCLGLGAPIPPPADVQMIWDKLGEISARATAASSHGTEILNTLSALVENLGRYSLDETGLAAFESDVTAGLIEGSGLIVTYDDGGEKRAALNPSLLTFRSPSGDQVYNLLLTLLDLVIMTPLYRSK